MNWGIRLIPPIAIVSYVLLFIVRELKSCDGLGVFLSL